MRKLFKLLPFVVVLFGSFSVPLVCGNKKDGFQQGHECEYCGRSFSRKSNLNTHIRDTCKKSPNAQSRTGYPCEYCGESFSQKGSLNRHILDVCKKSPDAQNRTGYPCEYCGKSSSQRGDLKKHIRDFCKKSPDARNRTGYPCEYCGESFSQKGNLNRHILDVCKKSPSVQNRTGYPCEYCGNSFSDKGYLNLHIRDFCKEKNEGADPQDSVLGKRKRPIRTRPVRIKQERGNSIATTTACINYLLEAAKDSEIRIKQEPVSDEERDLEPQLKRQKLWHENKD